MKPVITISTSNFESINNAKITINKWVNTFNNKSLPHVYKLHDHIERKKMLNIPKPDLSYTWTKDRKIIVGGNSNAYGINSHGKPTRQNIIRAGGGAYLLNTNDPFTRSNRKNRIGFLNGDIRFKSRNYVDNRTYKKTHEYKSKRVKPRGLGAHAVIFRDKKLANYVHNLHTFNESSRHAATTNTRLLGKKSSSSTRKLLLKKRRPQSSSSINRRNYDMNIISNKEETRATREKIDESLIADVKSIIDSVGGIYRPRTPLQIYVPKS